MMDTVLIVDDDPAVREVFRVFLDQTGFTAIPVDGGQECLELLKTRTPDIILLDLMMEPMDGWETLRAIRNLPSARQVPVMVVTGKPPLPAEVLEYGGLIEEFIQKPVGFARLGACLSRTLERTRDLEAVVALKKAAGLDPEQIAEYTRILRIVRITKNLIRKNHDPSLADRVSLKKQEQRLAFLHTFLGFPDRFLEQGTTG